MSNAKYVCVNEEKGIFDLYIENGAKATFATDLDGLTISMDKATVKAITNALETALS